MVNAAILVLHGEHPVQIVAHLFEDLGILRKFARNVPFKRIQILREILIGLQQRKHRNAGIHDILAVVARIVPATIRLDRLAGPLATRDLIGTIDNHLVVLVPRGTRPLARILRFQRHTRTLVVEPLEARPYQVIVNILAHDNRGAHIFATTEQSVSPRLLQRRNIESLHFLATVIPVVDHRGLQLKDRFSTQIANFETIGIATGVNDRLLRFRSKTQLVHQRACHGTHGRQRNGSRRRHANSRKCTFLNIHT